MLFFYQVEEKDMSLIRNSAKSAFLPPFHFFVGNVGGLLVLVINESFQKSPVEHVKISPFDWVFQGHDTYCILKQHRQGQKNVKP